MPGLARTLAQKAKKLQNSKGALTKFFHPPSCFSADPNPAHPPGSKRRKLQASGPSEAPSDEHRPSSTPASVTSTLPLEATPFNPLLEDYSDQLAELSQPEANQPSRVFTENVATSAAWGALLPKLVYPLMVQQQSRNRRNASPSKPPTTPQCSCSCSPKDAQVLMVSFTCTYGPFHHLSITPKPFLLAITPINIQYCKCTHPAVALIQQGAFTSTPVNPPKWAFDLQYLAFIREQFLAGIPNFSAWCNGTVAFLTKHGCQRVPSAVSDGKRQAGIYVTKFLRQSALARPLSSSLQHYQLVLDRISTLVERVIWKAHSGSLVSSDKPDEAKDEKGKAGPPYGQEAAPPPSNSRQPLSRPHAPVPASPAHDSRVQSESSTLDLSVNAIQAAASTPSLIIDCVDSSFHQPHDNLPSPYLRKICPLCFNVTLDQLEKTLKGFPNAEL